MGDGKKESRAVPVGTAVARGIGIPQGCIGIPQSYSNVTFPVLSIIAACFEDMRSMPDASASEALGLVAGLKLAPPRAKPTRVFTGFLAMVFKILTTRHELLSIFITIPMAR